MVKKHAKHRRKGPQTAKNKAITARMKRYARKKGLRPGTPAWNSYVNSSHRFAH